VKRFAIAGIQMSVSAFEENITRMGHYLAHVKHRFPWVDMVLFSELAAFGPNPLLAQTLPGAAEERLCQLAARHGLWLIPGSLFEQRDGQIFNTSPVINPQGEVVARFSKLFPFLPYEKGISAGDRLWCSMCPALAASVFPSATTCGSRKPPAPWRPWVPRSSCIPP
jgi:predicted amidohydrolase